LKTRILAAAAVIALFITAPVSALSDEDFAELTGRQVTQDITIAVTQFSELGPVWQAPYEAVIDFLDTVAQAELRVKAVTFPECLGLYRDTLVLGLDLLEESIEIVGRAAGVADDADRAAFSATGPAGYNLLTVTAPSILAVADCSQTLPEDVA
jgi:hypothetical protein